MVLEVKKPRPLWEILFSTHHTDVALLYLITSIVFILMGGALAMTIRTELLTPGPTIMDDPALFNRVFTVHATTMLFLWILPFISAIGNYLIPILVRYKDMAYPRVNAVAYWMIPPGAALIWLGWFDGGWYAYPPYSIISSPGPSAEMWIFGLKILGISSILGAINFIVTILKCKHPDLPLMKTSLFVWSILVTSFMTLVAIPPFAAALIMLYTDRLGLSGFFDPNAGGDPIAYQHLFWFTFHPEVYIFLLPAVGMAYEIIPKFSRKPIFSYGSGVIAFGILMIIGFMSWAHHMLATGLSFAEKTVFMIGTLAAAPSSSMHIFNWIATMWGGRLKLAAPLKFTIGGIMLFFSAGAGGVVNTTLPLDFITHDTYWVVGHFHLMLMGTISMIFFGFTYYIFPFVTGRMYNEKIANVTFALIFTGTIIVFTMHHILGLLGMPRRIYDYIADPDLILGNQIASIGAYLVGIGVAILVAHLAIAAARGKEANMEDPFGIGEQYYDYRVKEPHH
ncbi:MAG: cbb3-type cytochrome c oxidase subunit I [Candidatus Nitrosocaldaceae archaeon]